MHKETSSRISSIAGPYVHFGQADLQIAMRNDQSQSALVTDIRAMAGSCMSQDETPGQQPGKGPHKIPADGIHPAPVEFSDAQISSDPILHFFHYAHLPPKLQATSRLFFILAASLVTSLPRNAERTVALRKLLEAKDAAVRANLPAPTLGQKSFDLASERVIGEAVETGGHDEDRDGPVPFDN